MTGKNLNNAIESTKVGYYDNAFSVTSSKQTISLLEVLEGFRLGVWQNEVDRMRQETNEETRKSLKVNLPAITVSGVFSPSRCDENLVSYSGRIAIDFDNANEAEILSKLTNDEHTESLFKSCSGKGYALITRLTIDNTLTPELFAESYRKVIEYYTSLGLKPDASCKNISRLRYVTYDKDLIINKQNKPFCFSGLLPKQSTQDTKQGSITYAKGNRDNVLFMLAAKMLTGGATPAFVHSTIKEIIEGWRGTDKETSERGKALERYIDSKIRSASNSINKDFAITAAAIRGWIINELQDGQPFRTDNVFIAFGVHTPEAKAATRALLKEIAKEGHIINDSKSPEGYKRKLVEKLVPMQINSTTLASALKREPLILPLDIHKYAAILPKNVVVVAGAKSSGKSAFALAVAFSNLNKGKAIRYFSSEMADLEMCHRLESFQTHEGESVGMNFWEDACRNKGLEFYYKASNFADYILPDGINIVDFLEVHEAFYKVAQAIAEMYEKLNTGILLVCLQKSFHQKLGRGAEFSLEKARLYVTLDWSQKERCGVARIVDAKFPVIPEQPARGMTRKYTLIAGSRFFPLDSWSQEVFEE